MNSVGAHHGNKGSRTRGTGAYITGSDGGETRDSAAASYKETISSFAAIHGDDSIAFFRGISDRWGRAAAQKAVIPAWSSETLVTKTLRTVGVDKAACSGAAVALADGVAEYDASRAKGLQCA